MKKFLVVMMIAVVSMVGLFATNPETNTLKLTYGVTEVWTPDYSLKYKVFNSAFIALTTGETGFTAVANNPETIAVATDQNKFSAGYVEVVVKDNTAYNLSTTKTVTYAAAVTQKWKMTDNDNVEHDGPDVTLVNFKVPSSLGADITVAVDDTASITVTYPKYKVHTTATNQEIGRFAATWEADDTVEVGSYTAIVTLTVTAI